MCLQVSLCKSFRRATASVYKSKSLSLTVQLFWRTEELRWAKKSFDEMRKVEQCSDEMKSAEKNLDDIWDEKRWWGQKSSDELRWSVESEVRSVSVKCGVWRVHCEVWSAKSAVWTVQCGVWRVKSEVWSFKSVTFRTVHFRTMHARTGRADVRAHASSIDDKGLSYGITLRQLPPSCGYYWYCVFATPISSCETHALVTLKLKYCHVPSRSSFAAWTMRTLFFSRKLRMSQVSPCTTLYSFGWAHDFDLSPL